jgi:hypothetical protein
LCAHPFGMSTEIGGRWFRGVYPALVDKANEDYTH